MTDAKGTTMDATATGYESYTADERKEMVTRLEKDMLAELRNVDGGGLRADVARAQVAEYKRQIAAIKKTK